MPVITFFQTKGGTGKTTAAFAISEILGSGKPTTLIDADRRQPFSKWLKRGGAGHKFDIVPCTEERKIAKTIHDAQGRSTFVIVDTEGSGNDASATAVSVSDLVIITTTGSTLDQDGVAEGIAFVKRLENQLKRPIPVYVLMTRQKAVAVTKAVRLAEKQMIDAGINVFKAKIIERSAFEAIFGYSMTLFDLDPKKVSNPEKGYFNAKVLAMELMRVLMDHAAQPAIEKPKKKKATKADTTQEAA